MRRTKEVVITSGTPETNRDHGKVFFITELSATEAELWAADAIQAMIASGIQLPDGIENEGMAGIASLGFKALSGISGELMRSLMARMMDCVGYFPDPARREVWRGKGLAPNMQPPVGVLMESDIEEVSTRLALRLAFFETHTNFSFAAVKSRVAAAAASMQTRAA
jgi:hypothetical protein